MRTFTDLGILVGKFKDIPRVRNTAIHFEDVPEHRFREMTTKQFVVFYLFYDRGLRICEIAKVLGISPKAVRKRLTPAEIYYQRSFHEESPSHS
jgi:hypothetical protein